MKTPPEPTLTPNLDSLRSARCDPFAEVSQQERHEARVAMRLFMREARARFDCQIINGYCDHESHSNVR